MSESIRTISIEVFVQENGIIRLADYGAFLGRLDGISFEELKEMCEDME